MTIEYRKLTEMPNPYVCKTVELGGARQLVAASEGYGPVVRFRPPEWRPELLAEGPGGVLDVSEVPGEQALFMIGGCYPGYDFHHAGIYLLEEQPGEWKRTRVFDLPFSHRLHALRSDGYMRLLVTSITQTKATPEEWGRPGAVYQVDFPEGPENSTPLRPILAELHKNHGFLLRTENGADRLYVSGVEGVYRANVPDTIEEAWAFEQYLPQEISELHFIDFDGDGMEELVTIEPFHGNRLVVYKLRGDQALPWLDHEIEYGHGLWTGMIGGVPSLLVGNRAGHKNLELLQLDGPALSVTTIAEGSGTAQIAVLSEADRKSVV